MSSCAYLLVRYGRPGRPPEEVIGPCRLPTRSALVDFTTQLLDAKSFSGRSRRQVNLVAAWRTVQESGSSALRFTIDDTQTGSSYGAYVLEFIGLSQAEAEEAGCHELS